jgi:phage N-6-adenine-methyltransferase
LKNELTKYDAARYALQQAVEIDEVKDIRDKAQAMAAYARQAKDTAMVEWATEIKVRAERKAGQMLAEMDLRKGFNQGSSVLPSEISKTQSSRWQKLAAVSDDKFEAAVAAAKETAGEVTTAYMLRLEKNGVIAQLHTGDEESYTPSEYIESARLVMGSIDLDPASNEMAQQIVKADKYFTSETDGLKQEWKGNVWLNPPYTALVINRFIDKIINGYQAGDISQAVILTNNNTDTSWWHNAAKCASAVCFTSGRINFIKLDGRKSSPTNGQCFFYFGMNTGKFIAEFSRHGFVMVEA